MKFRLSGQPKPKEHKSIVPSHLLSDPAFSPDPHLNPYFAADQQLGWAPPQGHPVLKNKNKRPIANFALRSDIIASADFDFQLLQPPNSPVSILGGSGEPSSFPFSSPLKSSAASDSPALNTIAPTAPIAPATAPTSLDTRSAPVAKPAAKPAVSTVSVVPPQPPAARVVKQRRMPFLTRRKSQVSPPNPPLSSKSNTVLLNDVTRPLPPRMVTEPVTAAAPTKRPVFPSRSATIGTDTPRSTGASSLSATSKRYGSNSRVNDLDRIDELDETNPWGISLHHDGPYEAAVQAIRRGESGPSAIDSNNTTLVNEYHTQYGQPYVPPQAPPGVSLNLSPGQILPRNFGEQRPNHPRPREMSVLPPRMQQAHPQPHPALSRSQSHASSSQTSVIPPRHMNRMKLPPDGQSEPSRYRRQSQPVLPTSSTFLPQLPNPHPELYPEPRPDTRSDLTFSRRQSQTYQQAPLVLNQHPVIIPNSTNQPAPSNLSQQRIQDFQKDSQNALNISRRLSQASSITLLDSIPQPQPALRSEPLEQPRFEEPESASDQPPDEEMSFNIGMAMLQPEEEREPSAISISTPRIFLPPGTSDDVQDFDPYDPIHLNNEHSRTPSPLIVLYARSSHSSYESSSSSRKSYASRLPSPDHSSEAAHPEPTNATRAWDSAAGRSELVLSRERSRNDPPPYDLVPLDQPSASVIDDPAQLHRRSSHFRSPAHTSTSSRNASPAPSKRSTLSVPSEGSHHSRRERQMSQSVIIQDTLAAVQSQRHSLDSPQAKPRPMSIHENIAQNARPLVIQEQQGRSLDTQALVPPMPLVRSREHLVSPPPSNYAKSTHPSISTYSSSQARNGPPPANRHLPKRLVMPTPLNNMGALNNNNNNGLNGLASPPSRLNPLPQSYTPPRQIPPRQAQAAFQPQTQVYRPPAVHPLASKLQAPPVQPAQEIHTGAVRKLKKRASVVPPASAVRISPAPIISTVSFAPPVIGFGPNAAVDKALSRTKADKIPKRVLSKRRTDF